MTDDQDQPTGGEPPGYFEYIAAAYDSLQPHLIPAYWEALRLTADIVASELPPGGRVADLGTGTGNLAARLLEVHRSARVVCYDHVAEMLARAQEKLGPTGRAQFRQSDLRRAGLVVARFDAVMSGFFLHHLTDRRKAEFFRHVFNRLPPGGWFWNGDQVALGSAFLQERADARQQAATRDAVTTGDITSDDLALRDEFGRSARSAGLERHYYAPLADLLEWLRFAGFDPVDVAWLEGDRAVFGGRRPE